MNDFVAVFLVLVALATVSNFVGDGGAMSHGCTGSHGTWVRVCN